MYDLPTQFSAKASADNTDSQWKSESTESFSVGIPPVFGGLKECTSPEDFLALALANCYIATFKTVAQKSKADFEQITVHVTLDIDKTEDGIQVTQAHTEVHIHAENISKVRSVAKVAHDKCIVHNAVQFDTHINVTFQE